MGYERNDRSSRDYGAYGRGRQDWRDGREDYRGPYGGGDRDDRGFFERAGDEVRSWFGDEEAERRRRYDQRYEDRHESRGDSGWGRDSGERGGSGWFGDRDRDEDRYRGASDRGYGRGSYGDERDPGRSRYGRGGDYGRGDYAGAGYTGGYSGGYGSQGRSQGGATGWNRDRGQQGRWTGDQGHHDESYRNWRDRQMEAYDRDYHEYRNENRSKFESEFSTFRQQRQSQRAAVRNVREDQEVVGSDGSHVGVVDHVQGDQIKLKKNDQSAGGHHHLIPSSWVQSVDERVTLNKTAEEAKRKWQEMADEDRGGGSGSGSGWGDRDRQNSDGPHALNRSFSGTY